MKHSTRTPTKAESYRMSRISQMLCVACRQDKFRYRFVPSEVHHLLSGNKRRGHLYTIPLCSWHHRGQVQDMKASHAEELLGPSLARTPKKFRETFGTDDELLAITNKLLEGKL